MQIVNSPSSTRVLFLCTGVGRIGRGIETFFSDAFFGLKDDPSLDLTLVIGAGSPAPHQIRACSLSRTGFLAAAVAKLVHRNSYTVEQLSSLPSIACIIRGLRPHVVFSSEANLGMRLTKLRKLIGVPFRYIYSNGAPMRGPFPWTDFVHQVTPLYRDLAIKDGDAPFRHILLPYGFTLSSQPPNRALSRRHTARQALGLPDSRPIILSVGWISRFHKRMDYVISEVAKLPKPRPLLVLLGHIDSDSEDVIEYARQVLGPSGVLIRSVPPDDVSLWYQAADVFVLGSLSEGFGRVYVEALAFGLPVFCHDYPVGRYVNGDHAIYGDFSKPGSLANLLSTHHHLFLEDSNVDCERWNYVRNTFSWSALAPSYREMFASVREAPLRGN